jgi:hypothetical protein
VTFSFKKKGEGWWEELSYTAFNRARMTGIIPHYLTVDRAIDNIDAQDMVSALEFGWT